MEHGTYSRKTQKGRRMNKRHSPPLTYGKAGSIIGLYKKIHAEHSAEIDPDTYNPGGDL